MTNQFFVGFGLGGVSGIALFWFILWAISRGDGLEGSCDCEICAAAQEDEDHEDA